MTDEETSRYRLLAVDDEPQVLRAIAEVLADDYQVETTTDPATALRRLAADDVDVVMTDQRMPALPGDELLRRARETSSAARILVTGYADVDVLARAVNSGQIHAYISKPWDPVELRITVEQAARQCRMERALEANERRLRDILGALPEGIWVLDGDGRVTAANPLGRDYLRALAGIGEGDVIEHLGGRSFAEVLLQSWGEIDPSVEVTTDRGDRVFAVAARQLPAGSTEQVVVVRDVTPQKEADRRQEQWHRLAALGQFATGMAHDFNNLLTVTTSIAQLLQRRDDVPSAAQEMLGEIVAQGQRAEDLVRQIVDFARSSPTRRQPLDLTAFVHHAARLLERLLPERVRLELSAKGPCQVEGNPTQLQQVLTNLALNAREAMPQGGRLRICVEPSGPPRGSAAAADPPPGWACLRVADDGEGMSKETLQRLFEPYYTTRPDRGAGLGMAQVYGIVRQHRGEIEVDSRPGAGTTVAIYLPLQPDPGPEPVGVGMEGRFGPEEAAAGLAETAADLRGLTVLLVEDQDAVRRSVRSVVQHLGFDVLEAGNGAEALDVWRHPGRGTIDLVLTDLVMPVMGGDELIRRLRSQGASVPMVVMTGQPGHPDRSEPLPPGTTACLGKPLHLDEVQRVLRRAVGLPLPTTEGEVR